MYVEKNEYLNYSDVLIKPTGPTSLKSRNDVVLIRKFQNFECVPIILSNMDTVGTIEAAMVAQEYGLLVALHKFYSYEEIVKAVENGLGRNHFISIGQSEADLYKFQGINQNLGFNNLMIDVANGYREDFFDFLKRARELFPDAYIAAGNVCTPEIIKLYADAGVNAVKIGIGPGGQCRTRETAGIGVPQLTAVLNCSYAADSYGIHTIADGGINEYADFAKAFGAGADFVMAGSFFAGHSENSSVVLSDGTVETYGMSSKRAQEKYYGEVKNYRASEGRVSRIPFKGDLATTIEEVLGCIRSTCTYTDSKDISTLPYKTKFIKVTDTINRKYEKHTVGT